MAGRELISRSTRGAFRDLMTSSTYGKIAQAFQDEGVAPNPDCSYEDSSVRRRVAQEYLEGIDWGDVTVYPKVLRIWERLLADVLPDQEPPYSGWVSFVNAMARDGWTVASDGRIQSEARSMVLSPDAIAKVRDPEAIHEQLERLAKAADSDPALAIGSAKELVESTAKVVLTERGVSWDGKWSFPKLVSEAQSALGLAPAAQSAGPDGSGPVRRILGGAMNMVLGLDELRNGYGTGHGPGVARVGLHPRHARLAANAAITWCQLMLDTLADARAPWRNVSEIDSRT